LSKESFDQLIDLAHEALNVYEKSAKNHPALTVEQAFMNYYKNKEICRDIKKRLDEVKIRQDGSNFGYDKCVYYMIRDSLNSYEYSSLIVFTSKLEERLSELTKQIAEQKQRQTLKSLIKETIREEQKKQKVSTKKKNIKKSSN
jgi:hypothetical protein